MWRGSCSAGRLQSPTRHTREMAAAGRLRGPGLGHGARPELAELELGHLPGALGARGAIRPPSRSPPPGPGLETKRVSHAQGVSIIHQRENWHAAPFPSTLPSRSPPAGRRASLPAPGRDPPRTSPGRLPTPTWRTLGQALPTPFLRGSLSRPTLQRISHNNNTSLHPNRAVASELSEIRGFEQDPKSRRATPSGLPVGACPARCPLGR